MLTQEWNIQSRALQCAVSGRPFEKGERVFSALYWRDGQYERVDLCAEAWKARNENIEPLSAWQTDFVPPAPPEPEPLKKDDAESLLRRLIAENAPGTRNARYILALMLERKKVLRQIERQRQEGVVDPGLRTSSQRRSLADRRSRAQAGRIERRPGRSGSSSRPRAPAGEITGSGRSAQSQ